MVLDFHKLIHFSNSHKLNRVIDGTLVKQHSADLKTLLINTTKLSIAQIYSQTSTSHTTMVSSGLMQDRVVAIWLKPCSHKVSSGKDSQKFLQLKLKEIISCGVNILKVFVTATVCGTKNDLNADIFSIS